MNNTDIKTISILGCGWLGWPLAKALRGQGYEVKGSTTSPEKISQLQVDGIDSFLIDCDPDIMACEGVSDFLKTDALFVNIPFKRGLVNPSYYQQQITSIAHIAEILRIPWIIFASSTSVYPDHIGIAFEDEMFEVQDERAKVLWNIEQMLLNQLNVKTTILRFSGLFGPNRDLGSFAEKASGRHPDSPVNLVHLDDCVEIISSLIRKPIYGEIFNVCCDEHPSRRDLYATAASLRNQPIPGFEETQEEAPIKIVTNQKIKKALNYSFKYPHPLDAYR